MVLAVRKPCNRIHERHGLVIVLEVESLVDQVIVALPAFELPHQTVSLCVREGRHAAFAGFALLAG